MNFQSLPSRIIAVISKQGPLNSKQEALIRKTLVFFQEAIKSNGLEAAINVLEASKISDKVEKIAQRNTAEFSAYIHCKKSELKMTREDLAGVTGVSIAQLRYLEDGKREPTVAEILKIEEALG